MEIFCFHCITKTICYNKFLKLKYKFALKNSLNRNKCVLKISCQPHFGIKISGYSFEHVCTSTFCGWRKVGFNNEPGMSRKIHRHLE